MKVQEAIDYLNHRLDLRRSKLFSSPNIETSDAREEGCKIEIIERWLNSLKEDRQENIF